GYDNANRLLYGDFKEYRSGWNNTANIDFSMKMGDGQNHASAYDENGNIKAMFQVGLLPTGASLPIDNLSYSYNPLSNKLAAVSDGIVGDTKLGDFTDKNTTGDDYAYDDNGNLTIDKNKNIQSISYNHLNLPYQVTVSPPPGGAGGGGTITYIYDATGNKLEKRTSENIPSEVGGSKQTTTTYLGNYVYENSVLQFFSHEEGRVRRIDDSRFTFDYFLKDHLGNIRMMLTDEPKQDNYPALTFEPENRATEMALYENADKSITVRPAAFGDETTNNAQVQLLKKDGQAIGGGKFLKVMTSDKISAMVDYYTPDNTIDNSSANGLSTVLNSLVSLIDNGGTVAGALHGTGSIVNRTLNNNADFTSFLSPQSGAGVENVPKAYLNILFFDEQMKFVSEGSTMVPVVTKGSRDQLIKTNIAAPKNGYAYVYMNNESNNLVYFDNLKVTHNRGPLLSEDHYYPFGLTTAGISFKASTFGGAENHLKYNGKEEQRKEFSDGSGLEWYDYGARFYDAQIGRWGHVDPLAEKYVVVSPYSFTSNNPILFVDKDGKDITPTTSFKSSSYYSMYQKLSTSNSVYKSYLAPFANNKQMNYNLDAGNVKRAGDNALATTQPKDWNNDIKKNGLGMVTAINTTTTTWQLNEKADITTNGITETRGINDAGRALVLLHEGGHAFLQSIGGDGFHTDMTNPIAGGEHSMMASGGYQEDILKGLTELRDAGGISMNDKDLTNLSFYGLQGTDSFDKQFGIKVTDRKSQEYSDAVKNVYNTVLNPLIYTEQKKN
ncbi:MAG: hypothetical protein J0I41_22755, partial [Filimonas sp.]|nr:hypothetical protein [Filimonas sp.]